MKILNVLAAVVLFFSLFISCTGVDENLVKKDFVFEPIDTLFSKPYVDIDEWRDTPVRHRYVHGGFEGTDTRFSYYFPAKKNYSGRFFQYITPFPIDENLSQSGKGDEDKIGFSVNHGAYFIETNGGGGSLFVGVGANYGANYGAFRANAASAQFSRVVAERIYDCKRPFGYAFGGSGGAYRTIGGAENTEGVWDGVVPYVMGSPMAIPNVFAVRMRALQLLYDKLPQIIDAMEPGGSGDIYAGLNADEKEALEEATKMGFPPHSWFGYQTMGIHGFLVLYQGVVAADPTYFKNDFWNVPGYLGYDAPDYLLKARIQQVSKIKASISMEKAVDLGLVEPLSESDRGTADAAWKELGGVSGTYPAAYQLEDVLPKMNFMGGDLIIKSGEATGNILQIKSIEDDKVILGPVSPGVLIKIKPGDEVQVDNSNFLAMQTYYRHQVPGKDYKVWDQFRDENGNPKYPQRPMLLGPLFTRAASGVLPKGSFKGKMILLESLWDREAFPWQADWYRSRVEENLGDSINNYFRLWYTDRALHGDQSLESDPTRIVSYLGVLQQALLDLSDWVEKGIEPAATTNYKVVDGQVIVPKTADERKGIQPVVNLLVNGNKRADIKAGEKVELTATAEVPEGMGKIVAAAWNFDRVPDNMENIPGWDFADSPIFPVKAEFKATNKSGSHVEVKLTHTFTEPGTYFPTLRVASQRNGDKNTPYTRIQNLDRVRVVVE
ncbi:hypothetical protein [uncultured Draconibacterium sp.]|uniref:hypothetical protein n=1 Tax=uncultured Draconibacterium sp. TaxID=1573823 RepID=UPI003216BD9E